MLSKKAFDLCFDMKVWLHNEVESHILSASPSAIRTIPKYPDIIAGVVDCVANTTLLTLDRIMSLPYHGNTSAHAINSFDSPETVENWHRRALIAFEFVQGESTLAAQPLGIGLRQFQSCSLNILLTIVV